MALELKRSRKSGGNTYTRAARSAKREPLLLRKRESTGENSFGDYIKGFFKWVLGISVSSALLFALVMGLLFAYRYVTTNEYFTIRHIEIKGNIHFDRASILHTSGIHEGMNSLAINIAEVEMALRKTPWVAAASVKRHLPDSFEISITERMPAFWVLKDDELLYADSKGNLIAPVEAKNFLSLPALELEQGGELLLDSLDQFVETLRSTTLPLEIGTASWLKLSAARGFELYLEKHNLALSIAFEDWKNNLLHLGMVLNDLARRGQIRAAREVWAADGNVWVRHD